MEIENTLQAVNNLSNIKAYLVKRKDTENLVYKINELIKLCTVANTDVKESNIANLTLEQATEQTKEILNYFSCLSQTTPNRTVERCTVLTESILNDMHKLAF